MMPSPRSIRSTAKKSPTITIATESLEEAKEAGEAGEEDVSYPQSGQLQQNSQR